MSSGEPFFFATYSRRDRDRVKRIVKDLRNGGIQIWQDSEQLHVGDDWQKAISAALSNASGLIFFISEASLQSRYALQELRSILQRGVPVIPTHFPHLKKEK